MLFLHLQVKQEHEINVNLKLGWQTVKDSSGFYNIRTHVDWAMQTVYKSVVFLYDWIVDVFRKQSSLVFEFVIIFSPGFIVLKYLF